MTTYQNKLNTENIQNITLKLANVVIPFWTFSLSTWFMNIIPLQTGSVCVIGDPDTDPTVKSVGYFTSSQYVTKGISTVEAPTIPPMTIIASECSKIDSPKAQELLDRPETQAFFDVMNSENFGYKTVPYNPNGITIEDLKEFIELSDSIKKDQQNLLISENVENLNKENKTTNEEVD